MVIKIGISDKELDAAKLWRSSGYNVGMLFWTQYADGDIGDVTAAERSIWSTDDMMWRDLNGTFHNQTAGKTVTELLLERLVGETQFVVLRAM